ncbi:MAG TPA: AraC family transcriptional regulator [Gammaproteobacteria bacterium]|nr:AraC family transcriptional regulator [Gammaproteobacteria bacterium]
MDVLSDVLQVIRLNGAVLFRISAAPPWAFVTPPPDLLASQAQASSRLMVFHVVVEGACCVQLPPAAPQRLTAGEAVVLPRCDVHVLADEPGRKPVSAIELMGETPLVRLRDVVWGESDTPTRILCGFLSTGQTDFEPLFAALPPLFRVSFRDGDNNGAPGLEALLAHATREIISSSDGAAGVRLRITELLFVEALRRYMLSLPGDEAGWLAGLRDPVVGKALALLHADPCHAWSVTELASRTAVSRSGLATRFKHLLGEAPMHYLARWRLLLAVQQLHDSRHSIATIAESSGYDSAAAFQRAFKRFHGETPAACRKRLRASGSRAASDAAPRPAPVDR